MIVLIFYNFKSIIYSIVFSLFFSNLLIAGNEFNLIADQILISEENNEITALGNIKIFSNEKTLKANKIIFNKLFG